jgi:hypothetical protein
MPQALLSVCLFLEAIEAEELPRRAFTAFIAPSQATFILTNMV